MSDPDDARATMVCAAAGTPGYMSPEQAKGSPIDTRSNLFSVGVVGYEMLTGANPFNLDGTDTMVVLYRIVHEQPGALPEAASAGLSADSRLGIMTAPAKDPALRPPTAADMKSMLHGSATVVLGPNRKSLAIPHRRRAQAACIAIKCATLSKTSGIQ